MCTVCMHWSYLHSTICTFGNLSVYIYKLCNIADNFLCSCLLGLLEPFTGCLLAYVKETLSIGSRGEI
jgi:hypothetical protein